MAASLDPSSLSGLDIIQQLPVLQRAHLQCQRGSTARQAATPVLRPQTCTHTAASELLGGQGSGAHQCVGSHRSRGCNCRQPDAGKRGIAAAQKTCNKGAAASRHGLQPFTKMTCGNLDQQQLTLDIRLRTRECSLASLDTCVALRTQMLRIAEQRNELNLQQMLIAKTGSNAVHSQLI